MRPFQCEGKLKQRGPYAMKSSQFEELLEQRAGLSRRAFIQLAAATGAVLAWGTEAEASQVLWKERRDLFPEGVASGDPDPTSVILWTRRPFEDPGAGAPGSEVVKSSGRRVLTVEVAEDDAFRRVVAKASAPVSAESDWTTRVLGGHRKP